MRSRGQKRQASKSAAKPSLSPATAPAARDFPATEWLGWIALAGLVFYFVATSWRRWPDPIVDFGRELYVPWRLSHGALLFRDVEDNYGPLSQYLNAGVFAIAGPGFMTLVAANLAIFGGIVTAIYTIFRRAWGPIAAFVSSAVFISVFGFGQYVGIGNYNYATPYAHETTHGLFVCLLLVLVLGSWLESATLLRSSLAGGLFGLTALLKPEIMLAAGVVTLAAAAIRAFARRPVSVKAVTAWAGCAALPTFAFATYFSFHVPWKGAWKMACRAWLNVAAANTTADPIQKGFLGLDHLQENLLAHATATLAAVLLIAMIVGIAWLSQRWTDFGRRALLAAILFSGTGWLGYTEISWLYVGRCFLGSAVLYILFSVTVTIRNSRPGVLDPASAPRILIALLAVTLMLRMLLNGRLYQYGFYQAALAAILIPAVMIGELPVLLALRRFGKAILISATLVLLTPGIMALTGDSQVFFQSKTFTVGQGPDQFYALPVLGEIVSPVVDRLSKAKSGQTLLVLPEGQMINYLARMPSPVAAGFFAGSLLGEGREASLVDELKQHSPDWVAILYRDLREYGIERYGESPGKGQLIMEWVSENYEQELTVGEDPRNNIRSDGVVLLRRKDTPGAR